MMGFKQHTPEWNEAINEVLSRQREAMAQRLYPSIPPAKHLCFYPMDRKRGEKQNWYTLPMEERQRLMHDHGMIGRRYADRVRQVISGSIGLDDWEWAVDLFADDPLVFKTTDLRDAIRRSERLIRNVWTFLCGYTSTRGEA